MNSELLERMMGIINLRRSGLEDPSISDYNNSELWKFDKSTRVRDR